MGETQGTNYMDAKLLFSCQLVKTKKLRASKIQ